MPYRSKIWHHETHVLYSLEIFYNFSLFLYIYTHINTSIKKERGKEQKSERERSFRDQNSLRTLLNSSRPLQKATNSPHALTNLLWNCLSWESQKFHAESLLKHEMNKNNYTRHTNIESKHPRNLQLYTKYDGQLRNAESRKIIS